MEKDSILELQNVTKKFKGVNFVDNLSFTVRRGEVVGLLGPNGAGKTTVMRMIMGLMKISEGDVFINGISIQTSFGKAMECIGGIIENPEFYPFLTGYDNLMQYARMSENVTKERVEEMIELLGLKQAMHKKVRTYSLGMRQRLGIAQALLHRPSLIILDEPTNGLDPAGIREVREYLQHIAHEEGVSVLVSSHLLSEVELMCDRVVVIQNGKLVTTQHIHQDREQVVIMEFIINDSKKAKSILQEIEYVRVIGLDHNRMGVTVKIDNTRIPDIVKLFVEKDISIFRIEEKKRSLEESFLELTGGNEIA
ncbi:ABC transporter ATP-binding protein [Bacillus sp. 165]|uniref:ABC transporter ATP-binding protein n=1 Tax=Bacillus sp. 165 TaxID=1529117 RepID=UPI001ADBC829|nr:ABC transporter ATP-binding protein [Bacillus sp. 165]MBO9129502.1 ABC transporter ATP-binding protein [Bacillus sp. 165]